MPAPMAGADGSEIIERSTEKEDTLSSTIRIALAAVLLALGIAAGTSLAGPPPAGEETVTLRLANPEPRSRAASEIAEAFAARAKALSNGKVVVKILYQFPQSGSNVSSVGELEANLIRATRNGKAQLAIVPTRAFRAQGVTSFQALQAPFLIGSDAGMARATTGQIAAKLQSGLHRIGLTGLGLAPEGLRRPFGFSKALVSPADFAGAKIRAIPSKQTWALLRALGAMPVDLGGSDLDEAVAKGTVKGAESSLAIAANDTLLTSAFTVGNVAFFPKVDALVGNEAALSKLSDEQRSVLSRAAAAARRWAVASLTERRARNAFCKGGGTVVNASPSAISRLRAKARPVLADMRRDALTRSLIAELEPLRSVGGGVAPCKHAGAGTKGGPTVTKVIPPGVYRAAFTEKEFLAAGVIPVDAKGNAGTWTLTTTANGYQWYEVVSPYPELTAKCDKRKMYLRNGLVVLEVRGEKCGATDAVAWKLAPEGLRFTRIVPEHPANRIFYLSRVWKKIG